MKVKELIEKLQKEDPEMRVVVNGYETGFDEVHKLYHTSILKKSNNKWWDGEFYQTNPNEGHEVVLVLPRKS